ncbi:calcium-responsive transcription factor isoform X1 [Lates calcarifer]|uniref:Calcium-responsive transcription factor isoform X1 n=1 Tax=Lates calcarifer TaxID=8187 RepID=A0AAJ8B3S6_LATCA|nr:calcium-responsive transcription factor isoform X1 [Lates calcarifer]XP_050924743.1 calcium-responsive transcription factor isoform X1 [Lates calcarifer]XP_050924744.1 calcium-responsive transcription factor isoform X1 [Lates calcarifer]
METVAEPSNPGVITMETVADGNTCLEPEQSADPGSAPPAGPTLSDSAADTWMTSQQQAPPPAPCQNQLVILEPRGQTVPCERMVIVTSQSEGREVFVIPTNQLAVISSTSPAGPVVDIPVTTVTDNTTTTTISRPPSEQTTAASLDVSAMKMLPSGTPSWARRLRSVQKLGDSYRGFCCSEAELEAILLLHKQQTGCVFGTRQSPSVDKPATRLMWKSQYVPYDGIPFVNTGSRAIVMECQFGPRRKGLQPKKNPELTNEVTYKATCPARIYIKKVRKFPEFRVPTEPPADKKTVRQEQEKAFQCLKNQNLETGGVIRFYLQLPTERAHLYHTVDTPHIPPPPPDLPPPTNQTDEEEEETMEKTGQQDGLIPSRLHPRVAERIRQLVAAGHHQVYTIRKQLRRFVEKELFKCEGLPERHNLRFFPTINDIKNHIHESQKALGLTASAMEWTEGSTDPLMETVTLTLTPVAEVVDGGDSLSPEAVQLFSSLSSLQPKIFAQLQGILQPLPPPPPLSPSLPLVVSPSSFLQTPAGESVGMLGPEEKLNEGQQDGGGAQQVVLQNGQNVELQNINATNMREEALVDVNVPPAEVKEEEEKEEVEMKEMENSIASC